METRKAQLTGGSTFTVSLPKDWANEIGLETGDTLQLFPRDRTLVVQPVDEDDEYWRVTVDVGQFSESRVRRTIQALYTTGYDRMELTASTDLGDRRRVISETARKFIGLETIESTDSAVTLQSLLDPATVSIAQSTVQLKQVALSMHDDAVTALLEDDGDLADRVIERDEQVDRLYAMITRHFQRSLVSRQETEQLEMDQATLHDLQTTARQLERVGDHAEKVADLATEFDGAPTAFADEIESAADASRSIVADAAGTMVGDEPVETADEVLDRRDALAADLEDLERQLHAGDVEDSHLVALTLDSLARTADYGANVAETALQAAARDRTL